MLQITNSHATVWEILNKTDKYIDMRISTMDKAKDGTKSYSRWKARAIGKAFQNLKDVKQKDFITINSGKVSTSTVQDKDGKSMTFTDVVLFDAELYNSNNSQSRPQQPQTQYQQPTQNQAQPQYIDEDDGLPF